MLRWAYLGCTCVVLYFLGLMGCALPGTTRPTVKIGLVGPFEGWHRPRGYDALWAARLAVQEVNEDGGLAGHLVELVALDDHLDPRQSAQRAQELVADPAVVGVVGCLSPSTAESARRVYSTAGLPLITLASVEARGDGVFVLAPAPDVLARAAIGHTEVSAPSHRSQGADRPALLRGSEGQTWLGALQLQEETAVSVDPGEEGWLGTLAALRPAWVICTVQAQLAGHVLQQARDGGLGASFVGGPDWQTDMFRSVAADVSWGTWFVTGVPRGEGLPGVQSFSEAYRELSGSQPGPDAAMTYDATHALLAALEEVIERKGYPARQGTGEALADVSLAGITGPIRFDPLGRRIDASVWVYRAD
jgi:branched-chain amino acid transport system substrate-binding protein